MEGITVAESSRCISGQILQGLKKPHDCPAFGRDCTPDAPLGATMVSSEGACAAYYTYGRHLGAGGAFLWLTQRAAIDPDRFGTCPLPQQPTDRVVLGHGSGGRLTADLIERLFLPAFGGDVLARLEDQATVRLPDGPRIAVTTDAFVVRPLFFPGGDIGRLAVHGTVNDLAVGGAEPLYLAAAFILEEGLPLDDLRRIVASMRTACDEAGVVLVTGDTKVVDRGKADGLYITTTGVGRVAEGCSLSIRNARPGDAILVSGTIGDHGIAIMSVREGIEFETALESDTAPLVGLVRVMLDACPGIRAMRDPTRGGVSSALNELAAASGLGVTLVEKAIPVRPEVRGACELLGLDPLYVANEGKLLAVCPPEDCRPAPGGDAVPSARPGRGDPRPGGGGSPGDRDHEVGDRRRASGVDAGGRAVAQNLLKSTISMHELSIALSLIDAAVEESERRGGLRVRAIHLRIGAALWGGLRGPRVGLRAGPRGDAAGRRVAGDRGRAHRRLLPRLQGRAALAVAPAVRLPGVRDADAGGGPRAGAGNRRSGGRPMIGNEPRLVQVRRAVLKQNDEVARRLRQRFREAGVTVVSLVSSPGAGKTAFLERTLADLAGGHRVAALVGDLATENDADRLARSGAPARQIVTGAVCHLEAAMVEAALEGWIDPGSLDYLFIENVGNLVCPASYDLGEGLRAVLLSVTEGEDKPLKYPSIFHTADLAIVTKVDLADAVGFDRAAALANIEAVRPGMTVLEASAKTGQGMDIWWEFLQSARREDRRLASGAGNR